MCSTYREESMRSRHRFVVIGVLTFAVLTVSGILASRVYWRYVSHKSYLIINQAKQSLENDLGQNLRPGVNHLEVVEFLNSRKIRQTGLQKIYKDDLWFRGATEVIETTTTYIKV